MAEDEQVPSALVDRLRANLRTAAIPVRESDIEEVVARGYLRNVLAFERLLPTLDADTPPDYLTARLNETDTPRARDDAASEEPRGASPASRPLPPGLPWSTGPSRELRGATVEEIAALLRRRAVSPVEITEQTLAAIEAVNPALNAFQTLLAGEALATARTAEAEIRAGVERGPLHGVPLAAKDLLAMRGTTTSAGSTILAGWRTDFDAAAVERLRAAGAVIVGKTRLSEFAYSPGSNNIHYGPTANPWNPAHDTGGSSSGSAAAVAAGLVYGALGTDTGGSIRIPAALCGIVGLKPTFGRCSLFGAVTLAWSLDHLGPMTRSVTDAALMLEVLAGEDPRDRRTGARSAWHAGESLQRGVHGVRVGVIEDDGSGRALGTEEVLAAWRAGLDALAAQGAELVALRVPELEALRTVNATILVHEAAAYHEARLRDRLLEVGPFPRHRLLHAYSYAPSAFVQAGQLRTMLRRRVEARCAGTDVLSTPAMPHAAPALGTPSATTFTLPFNGLGWPAASVPVGWTTEGLPLGLQVIGFPWDEMTVLRVAYAVERHGPWRTTDAP